ncbi:MAG: LL-diaminopimelate aminotransferase, partial [Planctomycetaceae bacterium]|nr:LL-diaminopimelate aminotransferase [Planctomycetaceae bacterium]
MPFVKAERLQKLPPYLFAEIDKKKKAALAAGRDVINLGVGDPDRPTPAAIIRSLQHHVENP